MKTKKCLVCKNKIQVAENSIVVDCKRCGFYLEDGMDYTVADFPYHESVLLFSDLPRKEMRKRVFVLHKRVSRARKHYQKYGNNKKK